MGLTNVRVILGVVDADCGASYGSITAGCSAIVYASPSLFRFRDFFGVSGFFPLLLGRPDRSLLYSLYLAAVGHQHGFTADGGSLLPMSGCFLISSLSAFRPPFASENSRSHSFNSERRICCLGSVDMLCSAHISASGFQSVARGLQVGNQRTRKFDKREITRIFCQPRPMTSTQFHHKFST